MKFFSYCFYRISSAYKFLDSTGYYIYGSGVVSACQSFNTITIISVLLSFSRYKLSNEIITTTIIFYFVINFFLYGKDKYKKLQKRWKDEKHKTLKGWFVFVYIISICF